MSLHYVRQAYKLHGENLLTDKLFFMLFLLSRFMNQKWQHGDSVPNPADVAIGPQLYDTHVYFNFGGVSDQTEESYMQVICNLTAVMDSAKVGDAPLIFGEFSVSFCLNEQELFY